ncbi:hypothetical protein GCM10010533_20540 [Mycolicibacterium pallens]
MACVVTDACRSDSRALDEAADSEADTDIEVRKAGASRELADGSPPVTLVQPTTPASTAAALPTSSPPIRNLRACMISTPAGYRVRALLGAPRRIHQPHG